MVLLKIVNYHTSISIKPINNHHHRLIIILLIQITQKLLIRILITFYDFSKKYPFYVILYIMPSIVRSLANIKTDKARSSRLNKNSEMCFLVLCHADNNNLLDSIITRVTSLITNFFCNNFLYTHSIIIALFLYIYLNAVV